MKSRRKTEGADYILKSLCCEHPIRFLHRPESHFPCTRNYFNYCLWGWCSCMVIMLFWSLRLQGKEFKNFSVFLSRDLGCQSRGQMILSSTKASREDHALIYACIKNKQYQPYKVMQYCIKYRHGSSWSHFIYVINLRISTELLNQVWR